VVCAGDGQIDIQGAVDVGQSSAMAGRKDDHDNADGVCHSRRMILLAEMLVVPFCPR
jgi:hypothetical protein